MLPTIIYAQTKLPAIFGNNMILQQSSEPKIWGTDAPGKKVTVRTSWNNKEYSTIADANGKFAVNLVTTAAGGPYTITVSGRKKIELRNILLGEVWLCAGQSNMEMTLKGYPNQPIEGALQAVLSSANDQIRMFTVPRHPNLVAQDTIKQTQWLSASVENTNKFSATAYFFGRLINQVLNVPVGLVHVSYGGSNAEAWMSATGLKAFSDIKLPVEGEKIPAPNRAATMLYNGMLHPVIGYGIKGAIWYQGESNYERPDQYETLFPAMVAQWRKDWGIGDFPFHFAQLAPYNYAQLAPYNSGGKYNSAYLRDAQRKSLDKIPNSGMISLIDVGEEACIHPMKKREAGERFALLALGKTYGKTGFTYESPMVDKITLEGNVANVKFRNVPSGMTSYGQPITEFEIAGEDGNFWAASATLTRAGISVYSPNVKNPKFVRYAFKDFVVGNVFNIEGLPLPSFMVEIK